MTNKWIGVGHLGKDPELTYTKSGTARCRVSMATSESYKDKATGEKREDTQWHSLTFWGKLAEIAGQYLRKGALVYIEGKDVNRKYTNKEGAEVYSNEKHVSSMRMLDKKGDNNGQRQQQRSAPSQQQQQGGFVPDDEDIPF